MRLNAIPFVRPARPNILIARYLESLVQIIENMKHLVGILQVLDRTSRKDLAHAPEETLPFRSAVEVVGHQETPLQQILTQTFCLYLREVPAADIDGIEPGPIKDFVTIEV